MSLYLYLLLAIAPFILSHFRLSGIPRELAPLLIICGSILGALSSLLFSPIASANSPMPMALAIGSWLGFGVAVLIGSCVKNFKDGSKS